MSVLVPNAKEDIIFHQAPVYHAQVLHIVEFALQMFAQPAWADTILVEVHVLVLVPSIAYNQRLTLQVFALFVMMGIIWVMMNYATSVNPTAYYAQIV